MKSKAITRVEFPERYLRVGSASKYLGLCRNTVRRLTDLGHIRAKRLPGGDRIYSRKDLDAFIDSLPDAIDQIPPVSHLSDRVALPQSDLSSNPREGGD